MGYPSWLKLMKREKYSLFVKDAAKALWGDEILLNRCIDIKTVKNDINLRDRSPRRELEKDIYEVLEGNKV